MRVVLTVLREVFISRMLRLLRLPVKVTRMIPLLVAGAMMPPTRSLVQSAEDTPTGVTKQKGGATR